MLNTELLPFFALPPSTVIKRRDGLRTKQGVYHLNVTNGRLLQLTPGIPSIRSIHALTPNFEHLLPDGLEIHTHRHDMSPYVLDETLRRRVGEVVGEGMCE